MVRLALLLLTVLTGVLPFQASSRLATGRWVKVSVPATGIYELTDSLLLAAGFSQPDQVRVFGYGGALQPEQLDADYLTTTDDLPQVPLCLVEGRRLFHAVGPVGWESETSMQRLRNPYSDRGYYFLTDTDGEEMLLDSTLFAEAFYPLPGDYHALYEVDDYAWYHGGRNLYDGRLYGNDVARTYSLPARKGSSATLAVTMSYKGYCDATVSVGDSLLGHILVNKQTTVGSNRKQTVAEHYMAAVDVWTFQLPVLTDDSLKVTIRQLSGADMRLDHIVACYRDPWPMPSLTQAHFPQPRVEEAVSCQNRHADEPVNMVIIIPPSGIFTAEAERLAELHRQHDGMSVRVVRADELYNEFSSGTPDANAYRRYLRMLYEQPGDRLSYLLLFGSSAWDNRLHLAEWSTRQPNDLLICYESENSLSETDCYVTDDYFCLLDDGEGADFIKTDQPDIAVGRFPVRTEQEARVMVDKVAAYLQNAEAGSWQNILCFMGDDGNGNMHMQDADAVATLVSKTDSAYHIKKVYWDAFQRTTTARGYAYPEVTRLVAQQIQEGALVMNYTGHGSAYTLSHESAVVLSHFRDSTSMRLPLWFTASCDVAPFDTQEENIAQAAVVNSHGGAIAFVGTSRTVYAQYNRTVNQSFMAHLLSAADGQAMTFGEALRLAKNEQLKGSATPQKCGTNRLHFVLLGDPALRLPLPLHQAVVDSINGQPVTDGVVRLVAGETATVSGHIEGAPFASGVATLTVKDAMVTTTCRWNPQQASEMPKSPMVFQERPTTLFEGTDSVRHGRFSFSFAVPKDISYSDDTGQLLVYAFDDTHRLVAHGADDHFVMVSADSYDTTVKGPQVDLSLTTDLLLMATICDDDGINISDSGIGHGMELTIDRQAALTYDMRPYFTLDFGSYRQGTVVFRLPALGDGSHQLRFRVWDALNNSTLATLSFVVSQGMVVSTGIVTLKHQVSSLIAHPTLHNLLGQPISRPGREVYLLRQADGSVKKMVGRGNK